MAECIGHIFDGRVGGDWRCERCGLPYDERLKELAAKGTAMTDPKTVTVQERLAELERYLIHEHRGEVSDEMQSEIRMLFNEALAGGPNMNGDGGPTLSHYHALDCVWAAQRITQLNGGRK